MPLPRDLFLAQELSETQAQAFLEERGFRDPVSADEHLQQLADDIPTRLALGDLAGLLLDTLAEAPDPDAALVGFCRYVANRFPKSSFLRYLRDDPRALEILTRLLGASPLLSEILIRNPEYLHWLHRELDGPPPDLVDYRTELTNLLAHDLDARRRLDALKRFQRREMLRIAGRDLMGKDTLRSTTEQLSNLADTITEGVLQVVRAGLLKDGETDLPGTFTVIGMGKLGGRELNYSSDIDLIYVYELDETARTGAHNLFHKLGRRLTTTLAEHTGEGYFYRVDLRLRPMGKRGNVAYSLGQSAQYYESLGETFERFALIKARPIAGDLELGQRFVDLVRPFVYRKYLDHAAIEELARYKARTDREQARREAIERNIKTGRGGIREVELFTQVFQLIYGGRHPDLQDANTLSALGKVLAQGLIEGPVLEELNNAYTFLRTVEHRLQIVHGGQTHTLPTEAQELVVTARRMGLTSREELETTLERHRNRVHEIYADLLERRSEDAEFRGRQLFRLLSGELSDDDATEHLRSYGLRDADGLLEAVRALDDAESLAHSKTSTRNLLANLLATLLDEIADCGSPKGVLNRLAHVVSNTGATSSLYRTLLENDALRGRLVQALDAGALFSERLGRYPELLDTLARPPIEIATLETTLDQGFAQIEGKDLAESRDPFRRFKAIEEFKALVEWLERGTLTTLNTKLSLIADHALRWAAERTAHDKLGNDPELAPDDWVIIALGKLGGSELTVHSDLDLVFLYDGIPEDSRRFEHHQTFVRALHSFLEQPTEQGYAYRIDTRLRPEGRKGALAVPIVAFRRYLETRAETWERMAWTRHRFVAGRPSLVAEVSEAVRGFVYGPWDEAIPAYATHLRGRMERELGREASGSRLDFKVGKGGLADIDFLLQVIQLREGRHHEEFRLTGTRQLLAGLPENRYVTPEQVDRLRRAYEFLRTLETVLRIEADSGIGWVSTAPDKLEPLAQHLRLEPPTAETLLDRYRDVTAEVRAIYTEGMKKLDS